MSNYSEELKRDVYKDLAAKNWLYARAAHMVAVFDASEMTAKELAEHVLKKLGLKVPSDPIMALTQYLEGRDSAGRDSGGLGTVGGMGMVRGSGMDGSCLDGAGEDSDFMSRSLRKLMEKR